MTWGCFWDLVERFQTLIAACLAFIGVYFTVVPTWKQVAILQGQRVDQIRERLAARYRMIVKALALLDAEKWHEDSQFASGLSEAQLADYDLVPDLKAAFNDRRTRWEAIARTLRTELTPDQLAVIQPNIDELAGMFEQCAFGMEQGLVPRDTEGYNHSNSGFWWHGNSYPDMQVSHQMRLMRESLQTIQGEIVESMVQPGQP